VASGNEDCIGLDLFEWHSSTNIATTYFCFLSAGGCLMRVSLQKRISPQFFLSRSSQFRAALGKKDVSFTRSAKQFEKQTKNLTIAFL
jgi:hypothetical protein